MYKDDNNAIRYLMKEMDPSEEMEFEKLMREDENLLIEVESLRATSRKLSGLPAKNPPKHVTQNIANELKQIQADKKRKSNNITFYLKRGIAAAFLLAGMTGGYYYYAALPAENQAGGAKSTNQIEPWVDRNEVLRFQDGAQTIQAQDIQQDMSRSYEKLQLVNDPNSPNRASGILLTGSSN